VGRDDLLEVFIILSDLNQGNSNLPLKDTYSEYTNRANVPFNVPIRKLNERQQWFLKRLHDHSSISNSEIVDYWCVSQKTAKRDINGLKQMGYISHEGSKRYGNYIVKTIL
jgi:predicted HTH transcriptional regulator